MTWIDKKTYLKRLVENKFSLYLRTFGAVVVEGPKWCGETTTASLFAKSSVLLSNQITYQEIKINYYLLNNRINYPLPLLIDEWQLIPPLWDFVRNSCDQLSTKGNYILTGSTSFKSISAKQQIFHSGTGRIATIKMYPMSLYELGVSKGLVSLNDLYLNINETLYYKIQPLTLKEIAQLIIKGGWPGSIYLKEENQYQLVAIEYLNAIINEQSILLDKDKSKKIMKKIIRSIARNESTVVNYQTIYNDIFHLNSTKTNKTNSKEIIIDDKDASLSRQYFYKYLDLLRDLYILIEDQPFEINYRSSSKISKTTKKHLIDPSLSCAALNLTSEKLISDLNLMGFMFEGLVIKDLRVYASILDAHYIILEIIHQEMK